SYIKNLRHAADVMNGFPPLSLNALTLPSSSEFVHYFLFEQRRSHCLIHVGNATQDYAVLVLRVQY
ncbi:MAG TPA: hypothetical protein VK603_10685, partial [Candidatus Saccharimonadales bacterium]|nr:hypothetical protein [Candidatus Saccharimonadales bacterium]